MELQVRNPLWMEADSWKIPIANGPEPAMCHKVSPWNFMQIRPSMALEEPMVAGWWFQPFLKKTGQFP